MSATEPHVFTQSFLPVLAYRHMKDVKPILVSLGLQESEVVTYITSLQKGSATVADLSHASGYSRQAVYLAIESLKKRGLMTSSGSGKKMLYSAEHPDRLLAFAKRREAELATQVEDLARLVPQLELQAGGQKPVVKSYDGKEGLISVLSELQATDVKEIYEFTDVVAMKSVLREEDLAPFRQVVKKSSKDVFGIYLGTPTSMPPTQGAKRFYFAEGGGAIGANIGVYGNKLVLASLAGKMQSVVIESPSIVAGMKYLFKLALKTAQNTAVQK